MTASNTTPGIDELLAQTRRIATEVAGPAAADVDRQARFPHEAISALKEAGALGAAVPRELGGGGCDIRQLAKMCETLGQRCASTAMIVAMHHIQVASIARHHGGSEFLRDYLRDCVANKRLIASATSEVGPSGDMRSSVCAVESTNGRMTLVKHATTMSYVQHADDVLISARRGPDSAPSDQVAVLALRGGFKLDNIGTWDTLGMRGTCSPGGTISVEGVPAQVLPEPFADIATLTMVPYSHLLWGACWYGLSSDAVSKARSVVRTKARKQPGTIPSAATNLAQLTTDLQIMRSDLVAVTDEYATLLQQGNREELSSVGFTIKLNNAKLAASEAAVDVVTGALRVAGIMAYKNDSPLSLGRQLRDSHSAALMINNDRIHATNASLLLVHKGE